MMISSDVISISFIFSASSFPFASASAAALAAASAFAAAALFRPAGFLGLFTSGAGSAAWYGLANACFFGGVTPLISSVITFAARVGLFAGGEGESV